MKESVSTGKDSLAVLVLPGSFNPVHSEHVQSLELARAHLERRGIEVVGAFLQPSSDQYVTHKLGGQWAMSLADRIAACELSAQANARRHEGNVWIHAWESGQTNGFAVPRRVGDFLNAAVTETIGINMARPIEAYMVCGADLVIRCGGWARPTNPPVIVITRPGVKLPPAEASEGWYVAEGDTQPVSSTRIREAISSGHWEQLVEVGCEASVVDFMRAKHEAGTLFMGCRP